MAIANAVRREPKGYGGNWAYVSVDKVIACVLPHLPGKWRVEHAEPECGRVWRSTMVREDGLRLFVREETTHTGAGISVDLGTYEDATGERKYADRWVLERAGVKTCKARMSVEGDATGERLARAIQRRVLVPAEAVYAVIREQMAAAKVALDAREALVAQLRKIKGIEAYQPSHKSEWYVKAGKLTLRVTHDGGLHVDRGYVEADEAIAFCKLVASFKGY